MHLDLPHQTYPGAPIDDPAVLERLPSELASALRRRNGCVGFLGALHVRGACLAPAWHSLRHAWDGPDALHELYTEVDPADVPFAEDGFGDQFLIREGRVLRLSGELGEIEDLAGSPAEFFARLITDAEQVLDYEPLLRFRDEGNDLRPGQVLAAHPPFVLQAAGTGRELRAEDAIERRRTLAALAKRLHGLPDGAHVRLDGLA
jgi:hypothetical protein